MRKLSRFHVAVALLAVLSVVSLLGTSIVVTRAPITWYNLWGVKAPEVTVFYEVPPRFCIGFPIPLCFPRASGLYSSWGRSQIHVLAWAEGLAAGDQTTISLYGRMYNPADASDYKNVLAYTYTISDTDPHVDFRTDIPSHKFYFTVWGPLYSNITLYFMLSFGS